ncbi:anti-sigma factor family protein [Streptomyces sp. NPDC003753]|uniref:anti-sigma factor family protein n=1 Tax=unclassified Streptomyces TaxID=2593676 RepID=UPI00190334B9|nr:zf-HC2 domain-containing protein [Streptomyces sp. Y2F8-2]GHJ99234.1 RNA polymerase subunit sigma [Streptomyces sp. Y2F8-2]
MSNLYGGFGTGGPGAVRGGPQGQGDIHETVGAYALGILDDAEATAFEAHLATCDWCAQQLDDLAGMEPMLAALADMPDSHGTPAIGESLSAKPSPRLVERLVDEVSERRAQKRRRSFYLVAAAAALIIGGPVAVMAVNGGDDANTGHTVAAVSPAKAAFQSMTDKVSATDPTTGVSATIAMQAKDWGTSGAIEVKGVKGPLKCSWVAVGKNGERETLASWSVPQWGYGIPDGKTEESKNPLYVSGAAAFTPNQIDHFELMTFDGKKLVEVKA